MNITSDEVGYLNEYIVETSNATGRKSKAISKAGTYNLDGVQAVSYGRIRYTEGGDYRRTEHMRDVLNAMLKKLQTKSI